MLKLRDFLHLPQLDLLLSNLIKDSTGLILLAGIQARAGQGEGNSFAASGLSGFFNILVQEILIAHPLAHAIIVGESKSLARVPRQFSRRVRFFKVEPPYTYAQQIEQAMRHAPGLIVVDRMDAETAPPIFRAARGGLRVLAQVDTVLRGPAIAHQLIDLGVQREQLSAVSFILTAQRISVLCERCRVPVRMDSELVERLCTRYPHLRSVCGDLSTAKKAFYRAGSCEFCHGSGYSGDVSVFDLFQNDPKSQDFFSQHSLLSLEEYALRLASQGQIDVNDLLDLESDHLRRTYGMLTASEQALTQANAELNRKLFELEASNRVLVQRTEVLMSLQDLGQALIASTELQDLASRVCRRAGDLCGADRVALYFRATEDRDTAEILAVRGWDKNLIGQRIDAEQVFNRPGDMRITRYMQPPTGFHPQLEGESRSNGKILGGLRVPLFAQDQQVGVMIVQSTQKEHFTPGETALLQTFANQAALAIQRAGLVDDLKGKISQLEAAQAELVKKERMERELELARQVQQSMLPQHFPSIPGFALSAKNMPARQVGGDFYDVIVLDDDHFGLVIADVADKGMPAALYMALTRSLLLAEARRAYSPKEVLLNVNHLLLELGELNGFVSIFYGVLERSTRRLIYTRAGHERPLLIRSGSVTQLAGDGPVLGIMENNHLPLEEVQINLKTGDRLILYTDGLSDVANEQGGFLGLARLEDFLEQRSNLAGDELCSSIFQALLDYRGKEDQFDDMTLLVIEVLGEE